MGDTINKKEKTTKQNKEINLLITIIQIMATVLTIKLISFFLK